MTLATGVLAGTPAAGATEAKAALSGYETITALLATDLGKKGPSLGDTLIADTELLTRKGGARLGTAAADCVQFSGKTEATAAYHCTQTYRLPGGDIVVAGLINLGSTRRQHLAIIGGTGRYRGATGQEDFTVVDGGTAFADTFHFGS